MDITNKIVDISKKDVNTLVNETRDIIYIRFSNHKEFCDFVTRLNDIIIGHKKEVGVNDVYLINNNMDFNKLLYPMYARLDRHYDILSISIIDNNYIVDRIDSHGMYDINIYKGEEVL